MTLSTTYYWEIFCR